MALSSDAAKRLMIALADAARGIEVAQAIDNGSSLPFGVAALIVATNVSQTVDFAALKVGDKVLIIPAALGTSMFLTVATAGTLGQAAVVGSLYVVLRAAVAPTRTDVF